MHYKRGVLLARKELSFYNDQGMIRIFLNSSDIQGEQIELDAAQNHHLQNVLRIKAKDHLQIVVDQLIIKTAEVLKVQKEGLLVTWLAEEKINFGKLPRIELAQCLPKQDKMAEICRKCTEIGFAAYHPIISSRVDVRSSVEALQHKSERWQKILTSASTQSQRPQIPYLWPTQKLMDFAKEAARGDFALKLLFWEEEKYMSLKETLQNFRASKTMAEIAQSNILLFVGPEGGLSKAEVELLQAYGFITVSLGDNILRVENAAFAAGANILYEFS